MVPQSATQIKARYKLLDDKEKHEFIMDCTDVSGLEESNMREVEVVYHTAISIKKHRLSLLDPSSRRKICEIPLSFDPVTCPLADGLVRNIFDMQDLDEGFCYSI